MDFSLTCQHKWLINIPKHSPFKKSPCLPNSASLKSIFLSRISLPALAPALSHHQPVPLRNSGSGNELLPPVILLGSSQEPMSCSPGSEMAQSAWLMTAGQQPSSLPLTPQSAHTAPLEKEKQGRDTREFRMNTGTKDKVRKAKADFPENQHPPLTEELSSSSFQRRTDREGGRSGESFNPELSRHY